MGTAARSLALVTFTALTVNAQAPAWLTNGLVAYYPFNGNPNDATGHGYDGEVHGAQPAQDRFGNLNAAYSFNGTNSFIFLTNTFPLSDTWTVSAWVRASSLNQQGLIFHIGTDSGTAGPPENWFAPDGNGFGALYVDARQLYDMRSGSGGACFFLSASPPVNTNAWFQVFMRGSTNTGNISINGTMGMSGWPCSYSIPVQGFIGAGSTNGLFFAGDIDDVRIYNRVLSDDEVQQLYAYESGPWLSLTKAVHPSFSNLTAGTTYQLQVSADMKTWTNHSLPFSATNSAMTFPEYFDVGDWGTLFFRLQASP